MKKVKVTIRKYEGLMRPAFETLEEIKNAMKEESIVQSMNAYLGAHPFNSAFEAELVDRAIKAGHKMKTEKSEKSGKDVVVESNAEFLKRTGFTVTGAQAQEIVDGLAWPPETKPRGEKVDAYTKVATDKVAKALEGGKTLEDIAEKLESKGFAVEGDELTKELVVAKFAEYLRSDE